MIPDARVAGHLGRVLSRAGDPAGTCFSLSRDIAVSACHVMVGIDAGERGSVFEVDPLRGGPAIGAELLRLDREHDLSVLRLAEPLPAMAPAVAATDGLKLSAPLSVTGVAEVDDEHSYRYLEAVGNWAGSTVRDELVLLGRMTSSGILPGMSGAPVLDAASSVVGVVSGRYNSSDGWLRDTVWIARTENLLELVAGLVEVELIAPAEPSAAHAPSVDPDSLAMLLRSKRLTEELLPMLTPHAPADVSIKDKSPGRIKAIRLDIDWNDDDPNTHEGLICFLEIYQTPNAAAVRSRERFARLLVQYEGFGGHDGDADSFTINGNREWFCGTHEGHVYLEVSSWPDSNAVLAVASDTVDALVRHVRTLTAVASR